MPFLCALFALSAWAQDEVPPPSISLLLRLPEDPEAERKKEIQKRLDGYIEGVKHQLNENRYGLNVDTQPERQKNFIEDYTKMRDCLGRAAGNIRGGDLGNFARSATDCDDIFRSMTRSTFSSTVQTSFETPKKFLERLKNEYEQGLLYRQMAEKQDVIKVADEFVAFSGVEPDRIGFSDSTEDVVLLATQVNSILLELNQSNNVKTLANNINEEEKQEIGNDLTLEIMRLGELLAMMEKHPHGCGGVSITPMDIQDANIQQLLKKGFVLKDNLPTNALEAFFAIHPEEMKKIKAFKITEGDEETWLYRSDAKGGKEQIWVMAEMDASKKNVTYSHFIIRDPLQEEILDRYEGLNLINRIRTSSTRHSLNSTTIFETEVGVRIDADFEELLNIGEVPIPTGKVYVAGARLRNYTPKFGSDNRLEIGLDRVEVVSGLFSTNGNWSVAGKMSYKTFDDKWRNGVEARVYNIVGGYSTDMNGKNQFHMGLMGKQNYITAETGTEGNKLNLGRQFASHRGGATVSTDFHKSVEFKVFILLD